MLSRATNLGSKEGEDACAAAHIQDDLVLEHEGIAQDGVLVAACADRVLEHLLMYACADRASAHRF